MDKRQLEVILRDQIKELTLKKSMFFCHRKEEQLIEINSPLAQVVLGIRRCGKSTLCFNALESAGVKYGYVNFDDERLYNLKGSDLNDVLEVLYKIHGHFEHLFIDEIQNIPEWHLFVNRLLRQGMHIIITGSNAKLLSGELATHLTGRHNPIYLYPFSFEEFCEFHKISKELTTENIGVLRNAFDEYLMKGGMPETQTQKSPRRYISTLTENILTHDLEERFRINQPTVFEDIANHILNIVPWIQSLKSIMEAFGIKTDNTVRKYLQYLKDGFLLLDLHKFSNKSHTRIVSKKFYAIDVAFMDNRSNAYVGENLGWRLETIVYLELLRKSEFDNTEIYYYSDRSGECDFVITKHREVEQLIQVSYDVSNERTLQRELAGLVNASKATHCDNLLLITDNQSFDTNYRGKEIRVRPAYDYLLDL